MALIQTVNPSDLYHLACKMARGDNFGYKGWRKIGDYLESLSDDLGENIEIDNIAICYEYSMAESAESFYKEHQHLHGIDLPTMEEWEVDLSEDEKLAAVSDYLQKNTALVICEDDLIIWQAF